MIRTADRAFVTLVGIALASSAILVALFVSLLAHVPRLVAGEGDLLGDAVPGLILFLATVGIALGLTSLGRQLWQTLQLIRGLLRKGVPMPARVAGHRARPRLRVRGRRAGAIRRRPRRGR